MYAPLGDASLAATLAHRGPFVTVYLDATRGADGSADVIDTRWGDVRESLGDADPDTVEAIEEILVAAPAETTPHGLVAVAADGELCFSARMPAPPERSEGRHSPLPNLVPYLAATMPEVSNLVLVADPVAPMVCRAVGTELRPLWQASGPTPAYAASGAVDDQMRQAVAHLASQENPELVVVAGDLRSQQRIVAGLGRTLVADVTVRMVAVDTVNPHVLHAAVETALRAHVDRARTELLHTVRRSFGARRRDRAVTGLVKVVAALRAAQVDTVVLADGPTMSRPCWIGPRPTEFGLHGSDARAAGVRTWQHDRVGSAMVRAIAATGARLVLAAPREIAHPQGVGALLR